MSLLSVNFDPSSLRGELKGIGKQVEKNLLDLPLVADEVARRSSKNLDNQLHVGISLTQIPFVE